MAVTQNKDTTPMGGRTQRYRIDGKAFLNGTIVTPSEDAAKPRYEFGPPGQHGKATVAVDDGGNPVPVPERAKPVAVGAGGEAERLQRQLDAAFAEIAALKQAGQSNGQLAAAAATIDKLRAELATSAARADDMVMHRKALETRIAELERREGEMQSASKVPAHKGR